LFLRVAREWFGGRRIIARGVWGEQVIRNGQIALVPDFIDLVTDERFVVFR
jgi:hypothetical protein